jgi:hypothetical protein
LANDDVRVHHDLHHDEQCIGRTPSTNLKFFVKSATYTRVYTVLLLFLMTIHFSTHAIAWVIIIMHKQLLSFKSTVKFTF